MKIKSNLKAGKGLGDYVADLTHATKLDKLADTYSNWTGNSCGCEQRQETLNQLVPNV